MRAGALALALLALAFVSGCDGGGPGDAGDVELDAAKDSGIEGLPVPEAAKPHQGAKDVWFVKGASYDDLVTWYEERLPREADWVPEGGGRVWSWCELQRGDGFTQWSYTRGRKRLVAHVVDIDRPTVQIGIEDNGGCDGGMPVGGDPIHRPVQLTMVSS